jgi:hypothetical protein
MSEDVREPGGEPDGAEAWPLTEGRPFVLRIASARFGSEAHPVYQVVVAINVMGALATSLPLGAHEARAVAARLIEAAQLVELAESAAVGRA